MGSKNIEYIEMEKEKYEKAQDLSIKALGEIYQLQATLDVTMTAIMHKNNKEVGEMDWAALIGMLTGLVDGIGESVSSCEVLLRDN